jgi:TrmH family RNA methyltransferase
VEDRLGALSAVRFVLCRPRNPENLGAAARALRCAGISRWAIVDPRTLDFEAARRVAVHAEDMLDRPAVCTTLSEALTGCALTIGTTGLPRPERALLSPREAARRILTTRGEVAVVFGDERSGMRAEEMDAVDLLASIPSDPAQPSWNLAQAIAIFAYEVRMAALEGRPADPTPSPPARRGMQPADPAALAAVDRALGEATNTLGKPHARRRLFRALDRSGLTAREAALWTAFLRAIGR